MNELSSFINKMTKLEAVYKRLPGLAGGMAVNFFRDRFKAANWVDRTREPWPARNDKSKRNQGRALLIRTGRLRRSIRIVRSGTDYIVIGSDVPYAQAHNEGATINTTAQVKQHKRKTFKVVKVQSTSLKTRRTTSSKKRLNTGTSTVRAHTRKINMKMPQRRFMGPSAILERQIVRQLSKQIQQAFK
jgi:phage gpG-like protein